jgi:hypothetical protein
MAVVEAVRSFGRLRPLLHKKLMVYGHVVPRQIGLILKSISKVSHLVTVKLNMSMQNLR